MVTKLVIQELMMSEEESQVPIWSYGLWKQAIQDLLIATVQTSEKLIRYLSRSDPGLVSGLLKLTRRITSLLSQRPIQVLANCFANR